MKFFFYIFTLLSGLIFFGCSNCDIAKNENNLKKLNINIHTVAKKKFNSKYKIIKNASETFAICLSESNRLKAAEINRLKYFIFDLKNSDIIYEDSLSNSNVGWENDSLVTVYRIPGMIKKNDDSGYQNRIYSYDVLLGKKLHK